MKLSTSLSELPSPLGSAGLTSWKRCLTAGAGRPKPQRVSTSQHVSVLGTAQTKAPQGGVWRGLVRRRVGRTVSKGIETLSRPAARSLMAEVRPF